jgi:acetyl esterase/lipase
MTLNTVALGVSLTPTVVATLVSHYLHRKSRRTKPTVHISYDEAIQVIRQFLNYAAKHTVEDIQAFTAQRVPAPHWVKTTKVLIPEQYLSSAATALINQLGPKGIARVGGEKWWQWRGPSDDLRGEWIEMKSDYQERERSNNHPSGKRIMLYLHGGAYFFGSVETHRYQLQRHARKLKGRVFAPEYRLAPQFPFPCALQDCLAAYLFLLNEHDPTEIIFAGDSAGGGMVLSILVTIRDQGLPLPAGAILISPWVDLTHSFPSVLSDCPGDYIPPSGFRYKPSAAWPPPNVDEIRALKNAKQKSPESAAEEAVPKENSQAQETAVKGYTVEKDGSGRTEPTPPVHQRAEDDETKVVQIPIDGQTVELKDQIQMYAPNHLISDPLVSPVLQSSLGGLPPLQILVGGGERLRDEQFYTAHKAANPTAYPPSDKTLDEHDPKRETLHKYPGTHVQLQVWDDLCHVAPTLSFTRPAKYMYRSIAQFGAWALACSQTSEIAILDDNDISPITSSSETDSREAATKGENKDSPRPPVASVGKAGDPLPVFKDHMIRQRVDKRGRIYPLDPPSSYSVLEFPRDQIGVPNPELVRKWMAAKEEWDIKFAKIKLRVQKQRLEELAHGFQDFEGDTPPPSSLAARRLAPGLLPQKGAKDRKSYQMTMWSRMASKHDKKTLAREQHRQMEEGRSRLTSVDAGPAGASMDRSRSQDHVESFPTKDSNRNVQAYGGKVQEGLRENQEPSNGAEHDTNRSEISRPASSNWAKSDNPMIVLPTYESRQFNADNASTTTLLHAAGTIPARSEQPRPVSQAGSGTIRSAMTADREDASTIDDARSLAVTTITAHDNASTRAVRNSTGVVGVVKDKNSTNGSVETLSATQPSGDLESFHSVNANSDADAQSVRARPNMPDREVFKTADEHL